MVLVQYRKKVLTLLPKPDWLQESGLNIEAGIVQALAFLDCTRTLSENKPMTGVEALTPPAESWITFHRRVSSRREHVQYVGSYACNWCTWLISNSNEKERKEEKTHSSSSVKVKRILCVDGPAGGGCCWWSHNLLLVGSQTPLDFLLHRNPDKSSVVAVQLEPAYPRGGCVQRK